MQQELENYQKKYTEEKQALVKERNQLKDELENVKMHQAQLEQETAASSDRFNKEKQQANARIAEYEQGEKKANQQIEELQKQLEQMQQDMLHLKEQLGQQQDSASTLKILQERMEYLFGQNTLQLEQATNALGQHISQTVATTAIELEAGIALQKMSSGFLTNSTKLPKSVMLELAKQLQIRSYDLIIEMGDGSTTHFIAQTLRNVLRGQTTSNLNQSELSQYVEASDKDFPKRILSFDHNRNRILELSETLATAGLANYVTLQFAPLVPTQSNSEEQLFYDCGTRLQQIAQLFDGRQASILIFVNIEPAETGPELHAVLPAVLQYLSAHQLDIIVNNSIGQEVMEHWFSILNQRGLDYSQVKNFAAGQIQHLKVNP